MKNYFVVYEIMKGLSLAKNFELDVIADVLNPKRRRQLESFQFREEIRNDLDQNKRDDDTSSPEVDVDIEMIRETPQQKIDRLLQESNKRDMALMAASSQCTTRYAALYAVSKNRGLDASLGKHLTRLNNLQEKSLKEIQHDRDTVKDDFRKTRTVSSNNDKRLIKRKSDGYLTEKRKPCSVLNSRFPPIHCGRKNTF